MPTSETSRLHHARTIVQDALLNTIWVAAVPFPLLDTLFIGAVQLNMIDKLCYHYGVPFSRKSGRALISSIIAGGFAGLGRLKFSSMKVVSPAGNLMGAAGLITLSCATTYTIGHLFITHLENQGHLEDFDASQYREQFQQLMKEGLANAREIAKA